MPLSRILGRRKNAIIIPNTMAKTALPITGTSFPRNQAGTARTTQIKRPGKVCKNYCAILPKKEFTGFGSWLSEGC